LDEVYLKIAGRMVYLWRAVDAESEVLDVLVQSRRNKRAALKLMRKLLKKYGFVPDKLVTDDLTSYAAAASDLGIARRHERGQLRNKIEPRIRTNRPDGANTRCRVSSVRGQPKDFSQLTQPLQHFQRPTSSHFCQDTPSLSRVGYEQVARGSRGRLKYSGRGILVFFFQRFDNASWRA
jgi:transposase-like protein